MSIGLGFCLARAALAGGLAIGGGLASCSSVHAPERPPERRATAADGVALAWEELAGEGHAREEQSTGAPALLFVHGWCGERGFWRSTMEALAPRWHVLALDLAGHGSSGAEREHWNLAALAGDVVAVAEAAGLTDVILVGHSMGAPVALLAAPRLTPRMRVRGVIGVGSLHDPAFAYPPGFLEEVARGLEQDFPRALQASLRNVLAPGAPPELEPWLAARMLRTDRRAAVALLRGLEGFQLPAALSCANVPVRVINAEPRPGAELVTAVEEHRRLADYDAVLLADVGHFPMLERPARFLPLLENWITALSTPTPER